VSSVMFLSMAASLNAALSAEEIVADIRQQVSTLLGPLVGLHRDPVSGLGTEALGERALLSREAGVRPRPVR